MSTDSAYKKGDYVYVFYRMKYCMPSRKYMAVLDSRHGAWRPRTGMCEGFVPAVVARDCEAGGEVSVEYAWPHFFTQRGQLVDSQQRYEESYKASDVKRAPTQNPAAGLPLVLPESRPSLSIITFRWGGMNEVIAPQQWGDTGSSVSDVFIDAFIDRAVRPKLGNNYEVWNVYVENSSDLVKVADTAHLIFGPNHPARRAEFCVGMYLLYPTGFEENCVPTHETGEDNGAALVDQKSVFRAMKAMERAGIPTRFPHASGFYELLTSKRWTSMMCLTPHLRVPPTVAVPRMLVEEDVEGCARRTMNALTEIRRQQAAMVGEEVRDTQKKGVAKLGFSWEALDVKFWQGESGLKDALYQLTQAIEISEELTGQPHDLETIIVQDYCAHDVELRLYVVDGKVEKKIYTKFCKIKENMEFGDFQEEFTAEAASRNWMNGDLQAMEDGERQCLDITNHWLSWCRTQTCDLPPAIRFDYFVGRKPGKAGQAVVWTLEICELGFSMLGAEDLPNKVFASMLRSCHGDSITEPKSLAEMKKVSSSESAGATEERIAQLEKQLRDAGIEPALAFAPPAREVKQAASPKKAAAKEAAAAPTEDATAAPEAKEEAIAMTSANILYIRVPPGHPSSTEDQQRCSGEYRVVNNQFAKDMPIWVNERNDRWLFLGTDDMWYVGDEEEKDLDFNCAQGYIRHKKDSQTFPSSLSGPWTRGPDWDVDTSISVSTDPNSVGPILAEGLADKGGGKDRNKKGAKRR